MNLETDIWKPFEFGLLIDEIYKAKANAKADITASENKKYGYVPFVSRTEANNNVDCFVPEKEIPYIERGNAITIGDTTSTIAYQPEPFAAGDHIVVIRADWLNQYTGLFIVGLLQRERFRYSYGRAYLIDYIKATQLKLPITGDSKPDWKWMENYIKSLRYKPVSTNICKNSALLTDAADWKEFYLHRIVNAEMGNGINAILTTNTAPKYNYVSHNSNDNGVVGYVDEIDGETAFPAGAMTLALGGSFLGSCFIQNKPFYTAQNVAVLQEKTPLSVYTKLFLATVIRNECKIKYMAFGRELNAHFRKDFILKLPAMHDGNGFVVDNTHEYSDEGYIPDWRWMENYMKSLPYSDRIPAIT